MPGRGGWEAPQISGLCGQIGRISGQCGRRVLTRGDRLPQPMAIPHGATASATTRPLARRLQRCHGRHPQGPRPWLAAPMALIASLVLLGGCEKGPSPEAQRIEELNLKIQQLEQRLNTLSRQQLDAADRKGKPPVGVIKSLTIRTGTDDDRLRIYWADGSTTDLPCTKEQSTFACG